MAVLFCNGIPHALCKIEMGGVKVSGAYYFDPACGHRLPLRLLINDDETAWELDPEVDAPELATVKDDPTTRPIKAVMTVAGILPGQVTIVISYADGDEAMLATYVNKVVWQPHRAVWMNLVDYNVAATGIRWLRRLDLDPGIDLREYGWPDFSVDCSGCRSVSGANAALFGLFSIEDNLVNPDADECLGEGESDSTNEEVICPAVEGTWLRVMRPAPISELTGLPDPYLCYAEQHFQIIDDGDDGIEPVEDGTPLPIEFSELSILFGVGHSSGVDADQIRVTVYVQLTGGLWSLDVSGKTPCEFWLSGEEYELEWTPVIECNDCLGEAAQVKFTPLAINLQTWTPQSPPETLPVCTPINICRGEATYYVRQHCHAGGMASYECELNTSTCRGNCEDDSCRPSPPFGPTGLISDEDAEDLGLLPLVDTLVIGGCHCAEAPTDTTDCEADGCSVWEVRRKPCFETGPGMYQWYWFMIDSGCTGVCGEGTCFAIPPLTPNLPDHPIHDSSEESEALQEFLDQRFKGGCSCNPEDAYTAPECPTDDCEDCDDVEGPLIVGILGHTFTMAKTGDCTFEGESSFADSSYAEISFVGGTWALIVHLALAGPGGDFDDGEYTATGSNACASPINMTFQGGSPFVEWPDPVSVTGGG